MSLLRLTCTAILAFALVACRERPTTPAPGSTTNATQQEYQRSVTEARRLETEADALFTVNRTRGDHSVRLVHPTLPGFTNELSTAADFQALASALPKHDTAVIQLWAVGWDTNRVTNAVSHLRQAGFRSIRAVAMRWGQSTPGPEL